MKYEQDTKAYYKDDLVAKGYHEAFASDRSIKNLRFRLVARNERRSIARYLGLVNHNKVLDIPTGTGKLAKLFQQLGCEVTACDISDNMLSIAKQVYSDIGYQKVSFQVCDAAEIRSTVDDKFDVVVCLRLLHRVPKEVRQKILAELSKVADHAIVSFGVESSFHKFRRKIRNMLVGGGEGSLCYEPIRVVEEELAEHFVVESRSWIIPVFSQEMVFLLKPA